jgi:hypothetical protein
MAENTGSEKEALTPLAFRSPEHSHQLHYEFWRGFHPQLLHQSHAIGDTPVFNKLSILKMHDINDGDLKLLTGWWHGAKLAKLSAAGGHSSPYFIVILDEVFNHHIKIRKGTVKIVDGFLYSLHIRRNKSIAKASINSFLFFSVLTLPPYIFIYVPSVVTVPENVMGFK